MKKAAELFVVLIISLCFVFTVAACTDGPDGSDDDQQSTGDGVVGGNDDGGAGVQTGPQKDPVSNPEAEEIELILNTILKNSINRLGSRNTSVSALNAGIETKIGGLDTAGKNAVADIVAKYYDPDSDEYYDYDDETVGSFFEHVSTVAFSLPVVMGDSLRSYMRITDFYGLKIGNAEEGIYGRTSKSGSHIVIEICGVYSGGGYSLYYMDITYNAEDDFSFSIYEMTEDKSYKVFYYGNSDMEFYAVSYGEVAAAEGGGIIFKNAAGTGFVSDARATAEVAGVIEPGFEAISVSDIKEIGNSPDHVIPLDIWQASYSEHIYGGQVFQGQEGQFDIRDGVLFGWTGAEEDCPETLMLPSGVTSVYYELWLPVQVKKLIIPSDIEKVVMERGHLEYLTTGQGEGGYSDYDYYEDLVECPAKYLNILQIDADGNLHYLDEIDASVSSRLFRVENGILYGNDDSILYIPENAYESIYSISVEGAIGASVEQMLYDAAGAMPRLRNIDIKAGYFTEYDGGGQPFTVSNVEFLDMLLNGPEGNVENRNYYLNRISVSGLRADESGRFVFGLPSGYIYGEPYPEIDPETGLPVTDPITGETIYMRDVIGVYGIRSVRELRLSGAAEQIEIADMSESTVNKLVFSGFENWKELRIGAGVDELNIPYSESPEYVFFDNTDEMRVKLPWSAYGVFERGLTSMLTDKFEFEDLDIGFDAAEYYSESRMQKLIFAELTAEESEAVEEIKLFDHNIYEGEYNGQTVKLVDLYGYNGDSSVIAVPSEFMGCIVNSYTFRTPKSAVTEIRIPATVRFFSYNSDVTVGKIVFGMTRSEFESLNGRAEFLLQYAAEIVFSDTELGDIYRNTTYTYVSDGLGSITIDVSADQGAFQVKFTAPDGKEYIRHSFDYFSVEIDVSGTEWSDGDNAYVSVSVDSQDYGDVTLFDITAIYYYIIEDTGKYDEESFELAATQEFTGRIEHNMQWYPYAPDEQPVCFEGTLTESCIYCGYRGEAYEYGENDMHTFTVTETLPADCTHPEREKKLCSVCGLERTFDVEGSEALGHDISSSREVFVAADCLEAAHMERACARGCGYVEKYAYDGEPLGHNFIEVIVQEAADCTKLGIIEVRCERCGFVDNSYEYRPEHEFAADDICDVCLNHRYFRIEWHSDQATLHRYDSDVDITEYPDKLVIPAEVRGIPVGIIDFNNDPYLKKVDISEGIDSLSRNSFANSSVTEAVLPDSLRAIYNGAFEGCYELKSVTLPELLTMIDVGAFVGVNEEFRIIYKGSVRLWSFIVRDNPYSEWAPDGAFAVCCKDGNIVVENHEEILTASEDIPIESISLPDISEFYLYNDDGKPSAANVYLLQPVICPIYATVDRTLVYSSSDAAVATVDQNGLISFHSLGVVTVTVETADGSVSASVTITAKTYDFCYRLELRSGEESMDQNAEEPETIIYEAVKYSDISITAVSVTWYLDDVEITNNASSDPWKLEFTPPKGLSHGWHWIKAVFETDAGYTQTLVTDRNLFIYNL